MESLALTASTVETGEQLELEESVSCNCYRSRETSSKFYNVCVYLMYCKVVFVRRVILVKETGHFEKEQNKIA